jgi:hypothetical protein
MKSQSPVRTARKLQGDAVIVCQGLIAEDRSPSEGDPSFKRRRGVRPLSVHRVLGR